MKPNHWPKLWILILGSTLLSAGFLACGDDEGEESTETETSEVATGEPSENVEPEEQVSLEGLRTHLDLHNLAHLADVSVAGPFLDFGTAARAKYTDGNFNNDWGSDGTDGDTTFSRLGSNGYVRFVLPTAGAFSLRLRIRKVGADQATLYLNGETLRTIDLQNGFREYIVPVAAEATQTGENRLQIRGTGTREVGRESVSMDVDWIHVVTGELPEDFSPPLFSSFRVDDGQIALWPSSRADYFVDVPADAKLTLIAPTGVHIRATPFDGEESEIGSSPTREGAVRLIDLAELTGKVARISFVNDSDEVATVTRPQVLVPMSETARLPGRAKNVIVLTIDTLRASKLRPYNRRTRVRTPVFDAFAADATVFENGQSPENWTKPAVASILTSLHPTTHNTKLDASELSQEALMVSEVFQAADFNTASFLANGYVSDRFGFDQGWDHYTNYIRENRNTGAQNVFSEAATWIEEHKDNRFFVYIQTIDPHVPYDPPDEFLAIYNEEHQSYTGQIANRRTANLLGDAKRNPPRVTFTEADKQRLRDLHDAEISYHDRYFGVFIEKLKELGLYEDCIFVITSDHGEEFEEHGSWGHGHSIYQELLHVPLVVRWPAAEAAGERVTPTVSTMDIAPTVLEASGVDLPDEFEGSSLIGYMRDQPRPGPAVAFSDFLHDRRVIRGGRWKLILRGNLTWTMFDLEADPGEHNDLEHDTANPIALRYLRILLGQYLGANDLRYWLQGEARESRVLPGVVSDIDPALCAQLAALGYVDARCE